MPIYEYRCKECEQIFEEWQKSHEDLKVNCPVCGAEAERIISNTSFVLKGTGWYVTDYSNGRSCPAPSSSGDNGNGKETSGKGEGKSENPPAKAAAAKEATQAAQS
ncbi:FmdB family zinc ribbon protein [Desulfocurvus sp. DL9XJH121]